MVQFQINRLQKIFKGNYLALWHWLEATLAAMNRDFLGSNKSHSYPQSVVMLIFHIIGTAVIFLSLASVAWLLNVALHWLNTLHPFSEPILRFFTGVEMALLYVDAAVSGFVLLAGTWRFCKEITGGR